MSMMMGIVTLLQTPDYNLFGDQLMLFFLIFWAVIVIVVFGVSFAIAMCCRVWKVKKKFRKVKIKKHELTLKEQFMRVLDPEAYRKKTSYVPTPDAVKFTKE
jgi:uncharacterized membrane protein